MKADIFSPFRLVGGTALCLRLGHRESMDIDLFTDQAYGTLNYDWLNNYLKTHFPYVDSLYSDMAGFGKSYYIGESPIQSVKLDLFYTDPFIRPVIEIDEIRFAHPDDIVAMKIDILNRGGRKKDFWDLHELMDYYSIDQMLRLHEERYPYSHNKKEILSGFSDFVRADEDFDPKCLKGKIWELIKLDILDALQEFSRHPD